jgi:hypothetical protein
VVGAPGLWINGENVDCVWTVTAVTIDVPPLTHVELSEQLVGV